MNSVVKFCSSRTKLMYLTTWYMYMYIFSVPELCQCNLNPSALSFHLHFAMSVQQRNQTSSELLVDTDIPICKHINTKDSLISSVPRRK